MKRKFLQTMTIVAMVFSVTACGGGEETAKKTTSPETTMQQNGDMSVDSSQSDNDTLDEETETKKEYVKKILKSEKTVIRGEDYSEYYEYDKDGNEIKYISTYIPENKVWTHVEYAYDKNGNKIDENYIVDMTGGGRERKGWEYDEYGNELSCFYVDENGEKGYVLREFVYTYDQFGNVTSYTETSRTYGHKENVETINIDITYDDNNRKIFALHTDEKGKGVCEYEWAYYDDGTVKEEIYRYGNATKGYTLIITEVYDKYGNLVKVTDSNGSISEWEYDENGNLLSKKIYDEEEEYYEAEKYTYDGEGRLVRTDTYFTDPEKIASSYTYEYDEDGILVVTSMLDEDGNVRNEETYEYDEEKNITKKITKYVGYDYAIKTIECTYYEE